MNRIPRIGELALILILIAGCSKSTLVKIEGQSHYTDPNTSVIPLGRVHGDSSTYGVLPFTNAWLDSQLKMDAINEAIAQKQGATMLINAGHLMTVTFYFSPLFGLFSVTKITYEVDGQAAKQELAVHQNTK